MSFFAKGRGIIWTLSLATEEILEWQKQKSFSGRQPMLYRRPGKDTGGISGSAARTTTSRPACVKTVLPTPEVQGYSVQGAKARCREKKRTASVKPANFSGNSGWKAIISAGRKKNRDSPKKGRILS